MKIAFIPANVSGVTFYRVWQPAEALRKMGHQVAVLWYRHSDIQMHPWEQEIGADNSIIGDINMACKWADVVVWMSLHNEESLGLFRYMKETHRKPMLMEMDDNVFSIPPYNEACHSFAPGSRPVSIFVAQAKESDGLIVSTPHLKEVYEDLNPNIWVVPNSINLSLWRRSSPRRQSTIKSALRIGFVGGSTHLDDLELVREPILDILARHPNVRFVTMQCVPKWAEGHKQIKCVRDFRPINKYPAWVNRQGFDIGIAPLKDNAFNRSKSNLRWLEYSAMGIPTVASPLTHFKEAQNIMLADSPEEWKTALEYLISSPARFGEKLGRDAQNEVKEKWSPRVQALTYLKALKEITNASKNTSTTSADGGGHRGRPLAPGVDRSAGAGPA